MVAEESVETKKRSRSNEDDHEGADGDVNKVKDTNDERVEMNDNENEFESETSPPPQQCISSPQSVMTSSTSVISKPKSIASPTKTTSTTNSKETFSPELSAQYYSRLFPFDLLYPWLSYDLSSTHDLLKSDQHTANTKKSTNLFTHREFSFTIEPSPGDEIYIRYQSFANLKDLKASVNKRNPRKIDIGAVFSHPPRDNQAHRSPSSSSKALSFRKFQPRQRELVFDIDLTDYDDVRNCGCKDAQICGTCWKMMGMTVKVMDEGLREDFGFQHVAWFYSGRRGVHAWICDESARELSDTGRAAVASYFEINMSPNMNMKKNSQNNNFGLRVPLHPSLERAHSILEPLFIRDILPKSGHGILASPDEWNNLLSTLPMPIASSVVDSLKKKWAKDDTTPEEKWDELKRYLQVLIGKRSGGGASKKSKKQSKTMDPNDRRSIELWPISTVFRYTYPRLDINVSKTQNHLLKCPFCVHPKTGRVCVPIDVQKVDEFDPFAVPTLPQLIRELDDFNSNNCPPAVEEENKSEEECKGKENSRVQRQWEKTSLKESFQYFEKEFLLPMLKDLVVSGTQTMVED